MAVPIISDDILSFATRIGVTNSQEINWMMEVLLAQRSMSNPVYDLIGGIGSAKPVMEVMNFKKTKGDTIVVTLDRPLGGLGTQGAATTNRLLDNIEDTLHATYTAKVGLMAKAVGGEQIMLTQTVIGTDWDQRNKKKLKEWFSVQMANEIQFEMFKRMHSRNTLYAGGKTSRNALTSADTLGLGTFTAARDLLVRNQAKPCAVGTSKAGGKIFKYFFLSNNVAMGALEEAPQYINLLANAGVRGDANLLFSGGQPEWRGSLLHSWNIEDGTQIGPLGAPVAPRAYLGIQLPAESDTDLSNNPITAHATDTNAPFFQYFPNAQFVGHEGEKIAADTSTTRYLAMPIKSGAEAGKIAIYSYTINNGNRILGTGNTIKRLGSSASGDIATTVGDMTYGSGAWTSDTVATGAVPVGTEIIPVNSKGQPFTTTFGLGQNAILSGWGSLDSNGGQVPGQRLVEKQDFGRLFALGWQQVWGCRATEDANNLVNGYVVIESAYNPDGWPTIE